MLYIFIHDDLLAKYNLKKGDFKYENKEQIVNIYCLFNKHFTLYLLHEITYPRKHKNNA